MSKEGHYKEGKKRTKMDGKDQARRNVGMSADFITGLDAIVEVGSSASDEGSEEDRDESGAAEGNHCDRVRLGRRYARGF